MKILLTSNGIVNSRISDALKKLLEVPIGNARIAYVPTASDINDRDKNWVPKNMYNLSKLGFGYFDIVNIAALPTNLILERLSKADLIYFAGGNPFYLIYWLRKTGLDQKLPDLLKDRVFASDSAGGMVLGPRITIKPNKTSKPFLGKQQDNGLNIVSFSLMPHVDFGDLSATKSMISGDPQKNGEKIYLLDDQSAIQVADGKIDIISDGRAELLY